MSLSRPLALLATLFVPVVCIAAESDQYAAMVQADKPIGYWRLHEAKGKQVTSEVLLPDSSIHLEGIITGEIALQSSGPRAGEFPLFAPDNAAAEFTGKRGFIRVKDLGANSPLDFDNGDAITLEAWVNPQQVKVGQYLYIVGKGRTENSGKLATNQNYALRLKVVGNGQAAISFLFRSAGEKSDWHRWTSSKTFMMGDGWHHVAVTYVFGKSKSLRGYIDGQSTPGKWDMGGETAAAPVVDDDELWIGSSMGGQTGSSFHGALDEVAMYRSALKPERISARFQYNEAEPTFDLTRVPSDSVLVDVFEGLPNKKTWRFREPRQTGTFSLPALAIVDIPHKYSPRGIRIDRSNPYLIRAMTQVTVPNGPQRLLLRCHNAARLYVDGKKVLETPFFNISGSAHGKVVPLDTSLADNIRPLPRGDTQRHMEFEGDGQPHAFVLEMIVGGQNHRPEFGETCVSLATPDGGFHLLSPTLNVPLTDAGWTSFEAGQYDLLVQLDAEARQAATVDERKYWDQRHKVAREVVAKRAAIEVPAAPKKSKVAGEIDRFIAAKLTAAGQKPAAAIDDAAFLRRVTLDVIGTIPTPEQIAQFAADRDRPDRRARLIDRLLQHPGWADNWVGYWQDVLAENPNIIKPTLNNTGPFRWWIHESFLDNKPFDRFATELVMMEGSKLYGGPGGFEMATQNDAPMAAKAQVIGQAFLGLEMKCARCHDAPFHDSKQRQLFNVAAMLKRGAQQVPKTSTIPGGEDFVKSLVVEVTLKPGEKIPAEWPFPQLSPDEFPEGTLRKDNDPRERLAALITSPHNERFAQVIANRLWRRYLGHGLVEPVDDWQDAEPSHPELLNWLARELASHDYDLKHLARLILNSQTYQRAPAGRDALKMDEPYLFAAPIQRRMTAEQLVDSLFVASGKPFDVGPLSLDIDGAMNFKSSLNLGAPRRAWEFTSTANERDRPSLALPFAQPLSPSWRPLAGAARGKIR